MPVADAVLYDAGDIARIDGKELAADGRLGDSGFDVVGDAVELPSQRIGDHRDRFGEADMADVAALDFAVELLSAEPRADFLLERQSPRPGVLHAMDGDRIDPLARRRQDN